MGGRLYLSLLVLCAVAFAGPARAAIYKYVDEQGVCHYTNVPGDKRYRPVNLNSPPRASVKRIGSGRTSADRSPTRRFVKPHRRSTAVDDFAHQIRRAARAHRVDPLLIRAIIKVESDFNPYAVSSQGAQGLMQLMPATARDLQVKDPFDAGQNIYGGTRYIRSLLDSYQGDLRLSLAAYNAGPSRVKNTVPRIPETVAYVRKVMRLYRQYLRAGSAGTRINVRQLVTIN